MTGTIELEASFEEFRLDVQARYHRTTPELPRSRPSLRKIQESEEGARQLVGLLLRRNADRVRSEQASSRAVVLFHFDH